MHQLNHSLVMDPVQSSDLSPVAKADCSYLSESSCLDSGLPEPPWEPLQSDCCGSGCRPCVFDIYHEDLAKWKELLQMTPEQRAAMALKSRVSTKSGCLPVALCRTEYRDFEVVKMEEVCAAVHRFEFALPPACELGVGVGQHITLRVKSADGGFISRQYTPISRPDQSGWFAVILKSYEGGAMSNCVRNWLPGVKASWRGPFGDFHYITNKYRRILMLACGTGIAPMIQISRAIVENEDEETVIRCLYACRTQHQILVKQELDQFAEFWNFTVLYVLSRSSPESVAGDSGMLRYGDQVEYGRITMDAVAREITKMTRRKCGAEEKDIVLICGTKSFDKDMINFVTKSSKLAYFKF